MALPKKNNMVEYRWKIKYPDERPNVSGKWVVSKKAAMKDFFLTVCSKPELASSLTKELKETIYLDKRILKERRNILWIVAFAPTIPLNTTNTNFSLGKSLEIGGLPGKDKMPKENGSVILGPLDGPIRRETDGPKISTSALMNYYIAITTCVATWEPKNTSTCGDHSPLT